MSRNERIIAGAVILAGVALVAGGGWMIRRETATAPRTHSRPAPEGFVRGQSSDPQSPRQAAEPEGRTGSIAGTVLTADGKAVPDARVTAMFFDGRPRQAPERLTGGDGSFLLDRLAPGIYTLRARRDDAGAASREAVEVQADRVSQIDPPLVLIPGATVEIMVQDQGPLAGASLTLLAIHPVDDRRTFSEQLLTALSGPDGIVRLSGLADGRYQFNLAREGYSMKNDNFEIRGGRIVAPLTNGVPVTPWPPIQKLTRNR